MVKKIVWSGNALQDRLQILDYWHQRTGNKKYSDYLNDCFRETVNFISQFPQIGRIHSELKLRFMVRENYLIFYEEENETISILGIFDSRRSPELLKDKFNQ